MSENISADNLGSSTFKADYNVKMAYSMRLAAAGDPAQKVNYQVHCGKAMGAFNQWVRGTELESWENRHVEKIADKLMTATADLLSQRTQQLLRIDK